jgi:hypothetical protein
MKPANIVKRGFRFLLYKLGFFSSLEKEMLKFQYIGYLHEIGWHNSFFNNRPLDINKQPIPWLTYSFMDFLFPRLTKEMVIGEYGAGSSSLYFASKVKAVYSIESDAVWYEKIISNNVSNLNIKLASEETYPIGFLNFAEPLDIVLIDGMQRVECAKKCLQFLKPDGVVIIDDTEQKEHSEGVTFLLKSGYKKIDFSGISPGLFYKKSTTIFYKENNILNL